MSVVTDPTNEWYSTSQQSAVTAAPRRGVVLHHGATTSADQIIDMETSGSRQVSSNRVVKDQRCAKIVDDGLRAWSLSDAFWDSVLRSIECANESTAGWTISPESHETLAQMTAFWAVQDGFWPHRDGPDTTWTVFGHREIYTIFGDSYATACPGGMDLDYVAHRAQQILTAGPSSDPEGENMILHASKGDKHFFALNVPFDRRMLGYQTPAELNYLQSLQNALGTHEVGLIPNDAEHGNLGEDDGTFRIKIALAAGIASDAKYPTGSASGSNAGVLAAIDALSKQITAEDVTDDKVAAALAAALPASVVAAFKAAL